MKRKNFFLVFIYSFLVFSAIQCSKTNDISSSAASDANYKDVGKSANELLSSAKPSIVLEINYMPGYQLEQNTIDYLNNFILTYTNKGSLQVSQKEIAASGQDTLSIKQVDAIERKNRALFNTSNQMAVYLLMTDTKTNPQNTLGYAYRNTSIVMFGKTIFTASGGVNQVPRWKLEAITLLHEFGHLLGLVNLGSPMVTPHNDPANPQHCNNSGCLMYYETRTNAVLGMLSSGSIPMLDQNCHNDLIANGGK